MDPLSLMGVALGSVVAILGLFVYVYHLGWSARTPTVETLEARVAELVATRNRNRKRLAARGREAANDFTRQRKLVADLAGAGDDDDRWERLLLNRGAEGGLGPPASEPLADAERRRAPSNEALPGPPAGGADRG